MFKDEPQWQRHIERLDIDTHVRPAFKQALRERMLAEFEHETTPSRVSSCHPAKPVSIHSETGNLR